MPVHHPSLGVEYHGDGQSRDAQARQVLCVGVDELQVSHSDVFQERCGGLGAVSGVHANEADLGHQTVGLGGLASRRGRDRTRSPTGDDYWTPTQVRQIDRRSAGASRRVEVVWTREGASPLEREVSRCLMSGPPLAVASQAVAGSTILLRIGLSSPRYCPVWPPIYGDAGHLRPDDVGRGDARGRLDVLGVCVSDGLRVDFAVSCASAGEVQMRGTRSVPSGLHRWVDLPASASRRLELVVRASVAMPHCYSGRLSVAKVLTWEIAMSNAMRMGSTSRAVCASR